MADLLQRLDVARRSIGPSAVGQEIFDDVVAVGLEQHARAAVLADLPVGPLDHAVALAGHGGFHPTAGSDLEALFGARFGLDLGHFALLWCGFGRKALRPVPPDRLVTSVLNGISFAATAALSAGRREAGFMAEAA